MKKFIYISTLFLSALFVLVACEKDEQPADNFIEKTSSLTGKFEVTAYVDDAAICDPFEIVTRTTNNKDSISVEEVNGNFWHFQVKAAQNLVKGTFETSHSVNELPDNPSGGVKILNGKVDNSGSIYMEVQFEDDVTPYGITYQIKGQKVN